MFQSKLWKKLFEKKPEPRESQLASVVKSLKAFQPQKLRNAFSSDMSIFRITVCKKTVEEYSDLLRMILRAFEDDRMLYPAQLGIDIQSVYLRDFFIDKKGLMLDPVQSIDDFITLAVKFLTLYEQKEQESNKSFNTEKNLLLTSQVVSNLYILSKEL